jgi:hypothetical protein
LAWATETWPEWCDELAIVYQDLVPLDVRLRYFHMTAFSTARVSPEPTCFYIGYMSYESRTFPATQVIHQVQQQAERLQSSSARDASGPAPSGPAASLGRHINLSDYVMRFGRLRRRKIVLPRENILESAISAFEELAQVHSSKPSVMTHEVVH